MIKNITLVQNGIAKRLAFEEQIGTVVLDSISLLSSSSVPFDIRFELEKPIQKIRNHAYEWEAFTQNCVANTFHPKIVQLIDGTYLQANITHGIWELDASKPLELLWRFQLPAASLLTAYSGPKCVKTIIAAHQINDFPAMPTLVWSTANALEFSRSKIPFAAVVCFTDHCDFDTPTNMKVQREFFLSKNITTTKGFFLNHFSKRSDNISFEREPQVLLEWKNDGHELCYHSLSQSIKKEEDSWNDFASFEPPFPSISTWIDHGFQSYNLSLYKNQGKDDAFFSTTMHQKGITTFWNYIDSGIATKGVINQLNANQFTLEHYYKGIKNQPLAERLGKMVKMILFHHYDNEKLISNYQDLAAEIKKVVYEKKIKSIGSLIKKTFSLLIPLGKVIFGWKTQKKKPFKNATYAPLVFKHYINERPYYIFQTIEMNDFINGLHPSNIDLLIKEKGICIAHTYFSLPMEYHKGRFLSNENKINNAVVPNFDYLSQKIKTNQIWNPTLKALIEYLSEFEKIVIQVDEKGSLFVSSTIEIPNRYIQ